MRNASHSQAKLNCSRELINLPNGACATRVRISKAGVRCARQKGCNLAATISILVWNVKGLGSKEQKRIVKEMVRISGANVVILAESKKAAMGHQLIKNILRFQARQWFLLELQLER